jgi:hypothetical protein
MPRSDLNQRAFERWLARRRRPMQRGKNPIANLCGNPLGAA